MFRRYWILAHDLHYLIKPHCIYHKRLLSRKSVDIVKDVLDKKNFSPPIDWNTVRQEILQHNFNRGQYTNHNIDALILSYCVNNNQQLGFSYLDFMDKSNIRKNLATIGKYLQLLYHKNLHFFLEGKKCSVADEQSIMDVYNALRKEYPILDPATLENLILSLSLTKYWRKSLDLLTEIEVSSIPSSKVFNSIASAAFVNNDDDLGWRILEDMVSQEKNIKSLPFIAYMNVAKRVQNPKQHLERLFVFFHENDVICMEDFILDFSNLLMGLQIKNVLVNIPRSGICKHCKHSLKKHEISSEEFEDLRNTFFEKVIVGKDLFLKSNPDELKAFREFVNKMGKFDVVLDGLNVAYSVGSQSPNVLSAMVATVVSYFVQQNLKVLVLGRQHMNRWPKTNWAYVKENAEVFLTQDISQDDPYLLYCALSSGKDTIVVTKDLMRSHKFRLGSAKHKVLFNRWLSQRQYQLIRINLVGKPNCIFKFPPPYDVRTQENGNVWHIPYRKKTEDDVKHLPNTWLCVSWK